MFFIFKESGLRVVGLWLSIERLRLTFQGLGSGRRVYDSGYGPSCWIRLIGIGVYIII
jgi:hypothetical protein